jgi:hypothetical protein
MKIAEAVITIKKSQDELKDRLELWIQELQKTATQFKDLQDSVSKLENNLSIVSALVNRLLDTKSLPTKPVQKDRPAVAEDGESWDPSLGPRPKKKTGATAVARLDRVVVNNRADSTRAARKDNR